MKRLLFTLTLLVMLLFPQPAHAEGVASCEVINISGPVAQIQCKDALGNVIPAGQVNLPEVIREVEIFVPGPTESVTETVTVSPSPLPPVTLPPVTITKLFPIPGPTKTVTLPVPGPTTYVTKEPLPITIYVTMPAVGSSIVQRIYVTKSPEATPTVTATATVTASPVVVTETVEVDKPTTPNVLFDPPPLTPKGAVGYSVLALLTLCGLIIFGLWLGYIMGYKDRERNEMKFLDALRDQFYTGKHR